MKTQLNYLFWANWLEKNNYIIRYCLLHTEVEIYFFISMLRYAMVWQINLRYVSFWMNWVDMVIYCGQYFFANKTLSLNGANISELEIENWTNLDWTGGRFIIDWRRRKKNSNYTFGSSLHRALINQSRLSKKFPLLWNRIQTSIRNKLTGF